MFQIVMSIVLIPTHQHEGEGNQNLILNLIVT